MQTSLGVAAGATDPARASPAPGPMGLMGAKDRAPVVGLWWGSGMAPEGALPATLGAKRGLQARPSPPPGVCTV